MQRVAFFLVLSLLLVAPASTAAKSKVAPADEYFGRMKMSVLEITNHVRDSETRIANDPAHASSQYNMLSWTQDAVEDWARKYPADNWIPSREYRLSHLFWKMHTPEGNKAAERARKVLFKLFPKNHYAVVARKETAASVAPVPVAQGAQAPQPPKP